jgi:hypothetical protein
MSFYKTPYKYTNVFWYLAAQKPLLVVSSVIEVFKMTMIANAETQQLKI